MWLFLLRLRLLLFLLRLLVMRLLLMLMVLMVLWRQLHSRWWLGYQDGLQAFFTGKIDLLRGCGG
jgi:hypothetical protein